MKMVYSTLAAHRPYRFLGPRFCAVFDFLQSFREEWEPGRIDLVPDEIWLTTIRKNAVRTEDANLEYHKAFADLHYCPSGRDEFGWAPDLSGRALITPYNAEKDFGLVAGSPSRIFAPFRRSFRDRFSGRTAHRSYRYGRNHASLLQNPRR